MKNDIDFHKIIDDNGKLIGVLDINNMIPVHESLLKEVDIKIHATDSHQQVNYKNLVIDQLRFCRKNQDIIVSKANKLYRMINKRNVSGPLKRRCLKWAKLERILEEFIGNQYQ